MQTRFTDGQRQDPAIRESEAILRKCVHCGFCNATCPTYVLLGDELDSPRGRIYLIKDMLENDRPATSEIVRHVDRCLSCLACMTTCPSGVNYQHLVDHARARIEATYRRPWHDRQLRRLLAAVMPYPQRFRRLLGLARVVRPLAFMLPRRLRAALVLVPGRARASTRQPGRAQATSRAGATKPRARIAVMTGCVQSVLGASANAATVRLLERMCCEVVEIGGCCGSLTHHLGQTRATRSFAATFIDRLEDAASTAPVDAIAVNASGCGTHLKDYRFIFRDDAALAAGAGEVARLARDVTEIVSELGLPEVSRPGGLRVAYHSACSMQHGQKLNAPPRELLRAAGFTVVEIPEGHLCCGSAGTYNMLQPELAARLAERKLAHIAGLDADVIAAGNLGCMTQLATGADRPIVHTVELLDWATGGPVPPSLTA
ncbi:MAG TPA: glycolate oxidase subunit GlcF [Gammaproteobacteria bacterium]|nr:glycolate oxidase subunit GlcF [Gammaproteobacteria bacterium]